MSCVGFRARPQPSAVPFSFFEPVDAAPRRRVAPRSKPFWLPARAADDGSATRGARGSRSAVPSSCLPNLRARDSRAAPRRQSATAVRRRATRRSPAPSAKAARARRARDAADFARAAAPRAKRAAAAAEKERADAALASPKAAGQTGGRRRARQAAEAAVAGRRRRPDANGCRRSLRGSRARHRSRGGADDAGGDHRRHHRVAARLSAPKPVKPAAAPTSAEPTVRSSTPSNTEAQECALAGCPDERDRRHGWRRSDAGPTRAKRDKLRRAIQAACPRRAGGVTPRRRSGQGDSRCRTSIASDPRRRSQRELHSKLANPPPGPPSRCSNLRRASDKSKSDPRAAAATLLAAGTSRAREGVRESRPGSTRASGRSARGQAERALDRGGMEAEEHAGPRLEEAASGRGTAAARGPGGRTSPAPGGPLFARAQSSREAFADALLHPGGSARREGGPPARSSGGRGARGAETDASRCSPCQEGGQPHNRAVATARALLEDGRSSATRSRAKRNWGGGAWPSTSDGHDAGRIAELAGVLGAAGEARGGAQGTRRALQRGGSRGGGALSTVEATTGMAAEAVPGHAEDARRHLTGDPARQPHHFRRRPRDSMPAAHSEKFGTGWSTRPLPAEHGHGPRLAARRPSGLPRGLREEGISSGSRATLASGARARAFPEARAPVSTPSWPRFFNSPPCAGGGASRSPRSSTCATSVIRASRPRTPRHALRLRRRRPTRRPGARVSGSGGGGARRSRRRRSSRAWEDRAGRPGRRRRRRSARGPAAARGGSRRAGARATRTGPSGSSNARRTAR